MYSADITEQCQLVQLSALASAVGEVKGFPLEMLQSKDFRVMAQC